MVVPCIPCAAPVVAPAMATFFGVGATAVAARSPWVKKLKRKKVKKVKDLKKIKDKKSKKDKNKSKRKSMKVVDLLKVVKFIKSSGIVIPIVIKKEIDNLRFLKECLITNGINLYQLKKEKYNELQREAKKCSENCKKIEKQKMKEHKLKYSKPYKVINKALKQNCCKCHYVKTEKTLRKVKGPYSHCSYDMENCCKDKKTIVKSKK